ncbi:MAG TPA: hypothetical protein VH333_06290 [Pseudonocardiaceae bacterium]|jgi:hypothetical protein|nr:hypothetical protein [Pseudonocardiaceae bacterium]
MGDPDVGTSSGVSAGAGNVHGPRHARHGDADGPLDLSALNADDEMLTALCSFDHSLADPDQDPELKSLLLSWRLDVDAEPITELVDTDTALRAIEAGVRNQRRRPRYLVPLASAAAVLVIMFAGMSLAARGAHPGDALWGLSQVLYADHARSVEAAATVRDDLSHASEALQQGHLNEARNALAAAQASLPSVDNEDGKASLQTQQQSLLNQLNATTSAAAPPNPTTNDQSTAPVIVPAPTTTTQPPPPPPTTQTTTPPPPPTTTTEPPPPTTTDPDTSGSTDSEAPQTGTYSPQEQVDGDPSSGDNGTDGTNTPTG